MDSTVTLARYYLIFPLAALALLAGYVHTYKGREGHGGSRPTMAWAGAFGLVLASLAVWTGLGLVTASWQELGATTLITLGCAVAAFERPTISRHLPHYPPLRDAFDILLATICGYCALEAPWNPSYLLVTTHTMLIEMTCILLAMTTLHLLCQRRGFGVGLGVLVCFFIGLAQYFVVLFKGVAIMPSDLYSLGTAMSVSGNYSYELGSTVMAGLAWTLMGMLVASYTHPRQPEGEPRRPRNRLNYMLRFCGAILSASLLAWFVRVPDYVNQLDVDVEYFFTLSKYREQGLVPSFVAIAQDMVIKAPEGYTTEAAEELQASYAESYEASADNADAQAQFEEVQPTVIVIMNETFADLSIFSDVAEAGYEGPQYYKTTFAEQAIYQGVLSLSAYGGGTCNSEFEFLTGNSMAFIGAGKYPYSQYDLEGVENLAWQFGQMGYSTTAIHPNDPNNWSRAENYSDMGFDQFLSIDDFEGAPTLHSGVTDAATYDRILELLEQDDGPQFIFDVTMQNHSGYEKNNIPEDMLTDYYVEDVPGDSENAMLNEYLSCIEASDADLEYFVNALSELDRPVVLVFFGDHMPSIANSYNEASYPDEEDQAEHSHRVFQTTYSIWANYEVAGTTTGNTRESSTAYLAAQTLDLIGAPLTEYQKALLGISEGIPGIYLYGYEGADGQWYSLDDQSDYSAYVEDLRWISYLHFGSTT